MVRTPDLDLPRSKTFDDAAVSRPNTGVLDRPDYSSGPRTRRSNFSFTTADLWSMTRAWKRPSVSSARPAVDYLALVRSGHVVGLCLRLRLGILLGTRFGFALHSRSPA